MPPVMDVVVNILLVLVFSYSFTFLVRRYALSRHVIDAPGLARKIHTQPTALLGGVAVIVAFSVGVLLFWPDITQGYLLPKHVIGLIFGAVILAIGGALDDRYDLPPYIQILSPVLAAITIIAAGIGIEYITNPIGGTLRLDTLSFTLFTIGDLPYTFLVFADAFTFLWMLGMMYTTKFLDGLDGLVSGVAIIGGVILFLLSMSDTVYQPETALLALIAATAFLGFLFWNWHPAKIFLGESGSLFAGYILGALAIISGGKIATALLILGIPIVDAAWVIIRRFFFEKRSPFEADRKHIHLRLIDIGLSSRQAVLILYICTAVFGASALFLQSRQKLYAFFVVLLFMCIFALTIIVYARRKHSAGRK